MGGGNDKERRWSLKEGKKEAEERGERRGSKGGEREEGGDERRASYGLIIIFSLCESCDADRTGGGGGGRRRRRGTTGIKL